MANSNIGDAPAPSFAEYVNEPSESSLHPSHNDPGETSEDAIVEEELEHTSGSEQGSKSSSRRSSSESTHRRSHSRPTLAHRIYTQNLRVQANAKSLRARLLSGPLVDCYVGESKQHWSLHRNLLCHHSEYLSNEFLPSEATKTPELSLYLPEDDPAGFELLVKWLYQGRLDDVSEIVDPYQKYDYAVACHKLWLLCDRFDMSQLKNLAIDQYRKGLNEAELVPDANEMNEIFSHTAEGSPFRRLITRIAARQIMDPHTEKDAATYKTCFANYPDFAVELVNCIRRDSGGMLFEDPTEHGNACIYHDHGESPKCHNNSKIRSGTIVNIESRVPFQSNFRKPPTPPVSSPESTFPPGEGDTEDRNDGTTDTASHTSPTISPARIRHSQSEGEDVDTSDGIDSISSERDSRATGLEGQQRDSNGLLLSSPAATPTRPHKRTPAPPKLRRRIEEGTATAA